MTASTSYFNIIDSQIQTIIDHQNKDIIIDTMELSLLRTKLTESQLTRMQLALRGLPKIESLTFIGIDSVDVLTLLKGLSDEVTANLMSLTVNKCFSDYENDKQTLFRLLPNFLKLTHLDICDNEIYDISVLQYLIKSLPLLKALKTFKHNLRFRHQYDFYDLDRHPFLIELFIGQTVEQFVESGVYDYSRNEKGRCLLRNAQIFNSNFEHTLQALKNEIYYLALRKPLTATLNENFINNKDYVIDNSFILDDLYQQGLSIGWYLKKKKSNPSPYITLYLRNPCNGQSLTLSVIVNAENLNLFLDDWIIRTLKSLSLQNSHQFVVSSESSKKHESIVGFTPPKLPPRPEKLMIDAQSAALSANQKPFQSSVDLKPETQFTAGELLSTKIGHELLAGDPELRKKIQSASLNTLGENGLTLASNLCYSDAGIDVLNDPTFLAKIDLAKLTNISSSKQQLPLLQLASTTIGRELFIKRPILCCKITASIANITIQNPEFDNNSIMSYLLLNNVNLFLRHPNLVAFITKETLQHIVGKKANTSLAKVMASSLEYKPLFDKYPFVLVMINASLANESTISLPLSQSASIADPKINKVSVIKNSMFEPAQKNKNKTELKKSKKYKKSKCLIM